MRNMFLIAKREYLEQIRGRAFRVSTILVPLIFGGIIAISIFAGKSSGVGKRIVIAAPSAQLAGDIQARLLENKEAKTTVDVVAPATPADRTALVDKVQSKAVDGLLWIDIPATGAATATYTSQSSGDIVIASRLESALNNALERERLTGRGMS